MKKKFLLIGGTGFVGSHLNAIFKNEYEIAVTGRNLDIKNSNAIDNYIKIQNPDFVINLAAVTTLEESYKNLI